MAIVRKGDGPGDDQFEAHRRHRIQLLTHRREIVGEGLAFRVVIESFLNRRVEFQVIEILLEGLDLARGFGKVGLGD
jgi:hypothetical protein